MSLGHRPIRPFLLLVLATASSAVAQSPRITGRVVSSRSLRPLAGAVITLQETGQLTTTDAGGRFLFSDVARSQVTLLARRVGYSPLSLVVSVGALTVQIQLDAVVDLDAVVVTGAAGETEARTVGYSIGTISAPDVLQAAPAMDLQHLLNARVPGLLIMPYQGNVGTGARTRMRGVSSLSLPNEPLVYVDGLRVDNNPRAGPDIRNRRQIARINDLNAEDIERIEVVRGPAAATLYGTEASHGVIQIFTRRGTPGPLRLGVTVKQGGNWFMDPSGRLPVVWGRDSSNGTLIGLNLHDREVDSGRPIFQTGSVQSYGVTAAGGTPDVRYYISGALDRDGGMVWYNRRQRFSARANLDIAPHERSSIQVSLGLVRNKMRLGAPAQTYDLMTQLVWGEPEKRNTFSRGFRDVPPEVSATIDSRAEIARVIGSIRLRHQPRPWLTHHLTLGSDVGDETSSRLFPRPAYGDTSRIGQPLGELAVDRWRVAYTTVDYFAAASYGLSSAITGVTSVGGQYHARSTRTIAILGWDFPPEVPSLAAAAETEATEELIVNKAVGMYGQQQFGWRRHIFVTAALRVDDNSAFGSRFDFVTYPKLGGSWVLSEESWWPRGIVSALRLRGAWGRAGQQPDAFAAVSSYQPVTGPGGGSVLTPSNLGNPNLGPERSEELELGLDAGLWDDHVSITFTYFRQRTHDAIASQVVAPSTGFSSTQFVNVGLTSNRGFELGINADLVATRAVSWDASVSLSTNRNQVEQLGGLPAIGLAAAHAGIQAYDAQFHQEGFPLGAYFMPKVSLAWYDGDSVLQMMCAGGQDLGREDPTSFVPCNTSTPRVYAGQPTPTWEGAVRTSITLFDNLRLYGLVDFRGGHVMTNLDAGFAHLTSRNSRAINTGSDPYLMAYAQLAGSIGLGVNRRAGFMNAGFAKLREVSATYTLPHTWTARFGVSHATVTVAGRNLAILWRAQRDVYGIKIVDPEVGFPEDLNGRVQNALPQYAQFVTSLRVTF